MTRTLALTAVLAIPLAAHAQTYVTPYGYGGYYVRSPTGNATIIPYGYNGYVINPQANHTYNPIPDYLNFSNQITQQWNPYRLYQPR